MSGEQVPTVSWDPGTEVQSLYNFKGNSQEDLPFKKKDILTIVRNTQDPSWYFARNSQGKEGMIPANYVTQCRGEVKLHAMSWFHGPITRLQAEELLKATKEGTYLVRESTSYPGDYTLCVSFENKVEHYHIMNRETKLTIDEEEFFTNLHDLIEHYEKDADGLCTKLITPVSKKGNLDYAVDRQAFIDQGWVIKSNTLTLGEVIGKGEFGDVFKGEFAGKTVAVKSLKDSTKAAQQFLAEASVMTALRHPNLVQLMGVVLGDIIYIVTEFMGKGSLVDYLRSRGRSIIQKKDQINIATDACCGMSYLEEKSLVHRDLAARNVLIADDGVAKLADFGLARYTDSNQQGGKFPIKWTAPEALRNSEFTSKSDMWSFGILLWEIYSFGRVPYPRIPLAEVVSHVERGYRMETPEGCPLEIYDLMMKAWELKPEKRPRFKEALVILQDTKSKT